MQFTVDADTDLVDGEGTRVGMLVPGTTYIAYSISGGWVTVDGPTEQPAFVPMAAIRDLVAMSADEPQPDPVQEPAGPEAAEPWVAAPNRRSKLPVLIGAIAISALAVAGGLFLLTRGSDDAAFEPTQTLDLDDVDADIVAFANAAVATHGEAGGFTAVMLGLERGYSIDQLLAAGSSLQADGSIDGVQPTGTRAKDGGEALRSP